MKPENEEPMELVDPDSYAGSFHAGKTAEQDVSVSTGEERQIRERCFSRSQSGRLRNTRMKKHVRVIPKRTPGYPHSPFDCRHTGLFFTPGRQDDA